MQNLSKAFSLGWLLIVLVGVGQSVNADPATPDSERIAQHGDWWVVRKPATYVILDTGKRGRYHLCGAAYFRNDGWLEFEAKNEKAWSIYVADMGWSYQGGLSEMTLESGSKTIRFRAAMYGGPMISAMSHYFGGGEPISMQELEALMSQDAPISIVDDRGRTLATFPNNGHDLRRAFADAVACSMKRAPQ